MQKTSPHPARRAVTRNRAFAALALATASGLALSGCAGGASTDFSADFSVTAAVAQLPFVDDDSVFEITTGDIAGMAESEGVERTGDVVSWLRDLTQPSPNQRVVLILPDLLIPMPETKDGFASLGWDIADVDRYVTYAAVPTTITVVGGDLPALPADFEEVGTGVVTDFDAEDSAPNFDRIGEGIDRLGRPTRFAQDKGLLAMSTSVELAEQWAAAEKSMADHPGVSAIARALDEHSVMSAVITRPSEFSGQTIVGPDVTADEAEKAYEEFQALVPPKAYDMIGIGWSVSDDEAQWVAAYHFDDAEAAADGAQVLRAAWEKSVSMATKQPISSLASVKDVLVNESTVTVLLTPTADTQQWALYKLLSGREVLFASR